MSIPRELRTFILREAREDKQRSSSAFLTTTFLTTKLFLFLQPGRKSREHTGSEAQQVPVGLIRCPSLPASLACAGVPPHLNMRIFHAFSVVPFLHFPRSHRIIRCMILYRREPRLRERNLEVARASGRCRIVRRIVSRTSRCHFHLLLSMEHGSSRRNWRIMSSLHRRGEEGRQRRARRSRDGRLIRITRGWHVAVLRST